MFFYPVFLYPFDPKRFFAFQYDFNEDVISRSTSLSLLGIHAYFLGSVFHNPFRKMKKQLSSKIISTQVIYIIAVIFFLIYICLGGYSNLRNLYEGGEETGNSIANYFYLFCCTCIFSIIAIWFNNAYCRNKERIDLKSFPMYQFLFVLGFVFLIIATGSRTIPLQIIMIFGGLYTLLYKKMTFFQTFICLLLGGVLMFFVVLMRSHDGIEITSFADIVMDLVVNNRNTFIAVDYVDKNGITWGVSMLSNVVAPIPFLQQIIYNVFNLTPDMGASSLLITKLTLGNVGSLGMGTNIIADLYIAFGVGGVVIMMFVLGYFISYLLGMVKKNSYALIAYAIMISYSVYLVRAEYFFFLRSLLWCMIIMNIVRHHSVRIILKSV